MIRRPSREIAAEICKLFFNLRPLTGASRARKCTLKLCFNGRGDKIRTCGPLVPNQMRYQAAPLPEPCCHVGQALEQHNPTMASIRTGNRRFCWLSTINPRNSPGTCFTAVMAQKQNADGSYTFSSSPLGLKGQQTLPIFCASVTGTGWSKCAVCVLVY